MFLAKAQSNAKMKKPQMIADDFPCSAAAWKGLLFWETLLLCASGLSFEALAKKDEFRGQSRGP